MWVNKASSAGENRPFAHFVLLASNSGAVLDERSFSHAPMILLKHSCWLSAFLVAIGGMLLGVGPTVHAQSQPFRAKDGANPCPEGMYRALPGNECRTLDKSFGFDFNAFAEVFEGPTVELQTCTVEALKALLSEIASEGAVVKLPACQIAVDQRIVVPSKVVLQGSGTGKTILTAEESFTDTVIQVRHAEHVIIRDITVNGAHSAHALISSWYADNVLVERVDALRAAGNGIHFRYAQRITIRYSSSHGHKKWHGIVSKDCFPDEDGVSDLLECEAQFESRLHEVNRSPGVLWSQNYALYSNKLYANGDYGLDSHASKGEIAGNLIVGNARGAKFPDASRLWIHHNMIADNRGWFAFIYSTVDIAERQPRQIAIYANQIGYNRFLQGRFEKPAREIYLLHNAYTMTFNVFHNVESTVFGCPGSQDVQIFVYGRDLLSATPVQCTLENISNLFNTN